MASNDEIKANVLKLQSANATSDDIESYVKAASQEGGGSPAGQANQSSGMSIGPLFPSSPSDSPIKAGLKTLGNVIPSAANFAVGLAKQPIDMFKEIPKNLSELPGQISQVANNPKGVMPALKSLAGATPGAAYKTLVPTAAQGLIQAGGGALTGNSEATDQGLQTAQKALTNDPVGSIAPFLMIGREAAYKVSPEAGTAFDNAVGTVGEKGSVPVKAAAGIITKPLDMAAGVGKFGVSQATGLFPSTIDTIENHSSSFSKEAMGNIDRPSVASEIKNALDQRQEQLSETGSHYNAVREMKAKDAGGAPLAQVPHTVKVQPEYIDTLISDTTGLDIKDGKLSTSGGASIRDPKDVRALQNLYDTWKPEFDKGRLTANEFLNFRTDLGKMAKYEREVSKSDPLENLADVMRSQFNEKYRTKVPGLQELDAQYSPQIKELKSLKKGILDKDGNLTDASINKIANSTNKGRGVFLNQLEQIAPGITQKVKILKAIEDIEHAGGQKVGTYARAGAEATAALIGLTTGNWHLAVGAIAAAIMASPEIAVPIIRAYGHIKGFTDAILGKLKSAGAAVNSLPDGLPSVGTSLFPKKKQ